MIHFFGRKTKYAGTPLTLTKSTARRRTDIHENSNSAKNEQVDMRDLMIYQQVRRIDELERRISELQLELKQCEGQQGRTDRSSRATQTNQPSQSVQTNLTD
ncbi:hypothetical protein ABKP87_09080 [Bifidobacterium breve]|uniref:hypothetical protein n=1 Tax=Bifidobacterium breve TaxID=1685 RepID=UPI0032DEC28B